MGQRGVQKEVAPHIVQLKLKPAVVQMEQGVSLPHQKEQRVKTMDQILLRLPSVEVVALEQDGAPSQFADGGA